jgi:hypothetical protein
MGTPRKDEENARKRFAFYGKPLFAISSLLCGSLGTALVMFDKVLRGRDDMGGQ